MGLLRVLLALGVLATHSKSIFGLRLTGATTSVQMFYIISGFYMTMILQDKYIGKDSYKLFIYNRFLRIYPIYWVVLGLTLITYVFSGLIIGNWWTLGYYFKYFNGQGIGACIYQILTNIFLFGQDIVMFLGYNPNTGALFFTNNFLNTEPGFWEFLFVPQAWTLGIEITFYLIAPFIVRRQTWLIICLILSSLGLRLFIYFYLGWYQDPWTYRFFPTEIALFLMGTLSYRIYSINQVNKNRKLSITISIIFLLIVLTYQFFPDFDLKKWLLYILTTISIPFLFKTFKSSSLDSKIGEYSYPVYIVHKLIILYVTPFTRRFSLDSYQGALVTVLSFFTAYFLIKYIVNPIELVRKKRIKQLS